MAEASAPGPGRSRRSHGALLLSTLLLAGILVHLPALAGEYVWDDHQAVEADPSLRDPGNIPSFFTRSFFGDRAETGIYRPLVTTTFALDVALFGEGPFGHHLTNLLLHVAAALLLWRLLRRLSSRPLLPEGAALLFLVHPAAAEPVAWIVARGDSLALVLSLLTVHLHLSGRRRPSLHAAALLAYLLALFAKLAAGPVPLLVFLCEWRFRGLRGKGLFARASLVRYASYALPAAIYFLVRREVTGASGMSGAGVVWPHADPLPAVVVSGAVLLRSFFFLLFPVGGCGDYSSDPVSDPGRLSGLAGSAPVLAMALTLLFVLAGAFLLRRRAPDAAFGAGWVFVALLPVSQIVPIGAVMADRFLYFASVGACVALAAGLLSANRGSPFLLLGVAFCLALLTVDRERVHRDDVALNRRVLACYPENADAYNRLGLAFWRRGRPDLEEDAYREGLARAPGNRYLRKNLGALLFTRGRIAEAERELLLALALSPDPDRQTAAIRVNLAQVLKRQGRYEEAARVLENGLACRPPLPLLYALLGELYLDRLGRPERGRELLDRARALSSSPPGN